MDASMADREQRVAAREERLLNRMDALLAQQAELQEQDHARHIEREDRLQAQVDTLVRYIADTHPENELPAPPQAGSSSGGNAQARVAQRSPPPQLGAAAAQAAQPPVAAQPPQPSTATQSSQQQQDPMPAHGRGLSAPHSTESAAQAVLGAMEAVRDGKDVLADLRPSAESPASQQSATAPSAAAAPQAPSRNGGGAAPAPAVTPTASAIHPPGSSAAAPPSPSQPDSRRTGAVSFGGAMPAAAAGGAASAAAAAAAEVPPYEGPVEVQKAPQDGPPPQLGQGDDDIYWVAMLQKRLLDRGFYCGEEEDEAFFYGEGTESAVATFQACNSLPETGVADESTWRSLLGADADDMFARRLGGNKGSAAAQPGSTVTEPGSAAAEPGLGVMDPGQGSSDDGADVTGLAHQARSSNGAAPQAASNASLKAAFGGLFAGLTGMPAITGSAAASQPATSAQSRGGAPGVRFTDMMQQGPVFMQEDTGQPPKYTAWPVRREGDGDRAVHTLQIKLREHGFYPGEDDSQWWMFGNDTQAALTTFQACQGMPETGVCDARTWEALMGEGGTPEQIDKIFSGDTDDEDLEQTGEGKVWLLGEQRWASRATR